MKWRRSDRLTRSSTQSMMRAITGVSCARDHDVFAALIHDEPLERARRRARDDIAAQVVEAVVAGAPDLRRVRLVLHGAVEVRAHCIKRLQFSLLVPYQQTWTAAEFEEHPRVRLQLRRLGSHDALRHRLAAYGRDEIPPDGIRHRHNRGDEASAKKAVEKPPPIESARHRQL